MSWIFHELKGSRLVKYLVLHTVVSAVIGAMIIKSFTHSSGPVFPRYFITFIEAWFGSFAGGFLSIAMLIKALFLGYAGTGMINVMGKVVPMPVVGGVAGVFAFIFLISGIRASNHTYMYPQFLISSGLFFFSAYIVFVEMTSSLSKFLGL